MTLSETCSDCGTPAVGGVCEGCWAAREAEWAAGERRQAEFARRLRVERSGLPRELRTALPLDDDPLRRDAFAAAERWAGGLVRGLILHGPVGAGKTTIAAWAARRRLDRVGVRWCSSPLVLARIDRDAELKLDAFGALALILDDLDKVRPTEYGAEQVFVAVDAATAAGRPLLVTMNRTVGELAARLPAPYGEAVASRLAGYCEQRLVDGPDRRLATKGRR